MPEMRLWRRRRHEQAAPQVVLPSLDRLAGLIERVVELVDEVAGTRGSGSNHAPAPPERAPARAPEPQPALETPLPEPAGTGWLAFVPSPAGYTLVPRPDALPARGAVLDLDGSSFRVLRYAPSPLPGDRRRCAVVAREEPPEADRSFDA
jgi:hypothetical protein